MRLDHISINCKPGEIDNLIEFYEKLGFVVYKTSPLHAARGLKGYNLEHKTDRSLKVDIYESTEEPFQTFGHYAILVDDVNRVYEDWKKAGVDFGDASPPRLMPSGRILFVFKDPGGLSIHISNEMRKEDYISDYAITEGKKLEEEKSK